MRISARFQCLTVLKPRFLTVRYSTELFVSRLSFYTKRDEFKKMFSQFGNVKEARLIMDSKTGRTKGYGFVTFETEAEAQNAIKVFHGKIVRGRLIFVEPSTNIKTDATPKAEKS